jgi:hypothetical protein
MRRTKGCTPELVAKVGHERLQSPIPSLAKAAQLRRQRQCKPSMSTARRALNFMVTYFKDACFAPLSVASVATYLDLPWTDVAADLVGSQPPSWATVIISADQPRLVPRGVPNWNRRQLFWPR